MGKILVTGAAGQIGSELVPALRKKYGYENVIAAGSGRTPLARDIAEAGPVISLDITDYSRLQEALAEHGIDTIYHMSGLLSKSAEDNRRLGFNVNYLGLFNVLEASIANNVGKVIVPSSIAALGPFGMETPRQNTPNDTRQRPRTMYGMAKVNGELWADYYSEHEDQEVNLDVRGVRFPGLLTWKTDPNPAGTTDYANYMIFDAVRKGRYLECPLGADTRLPMMYMPDAIKALINLAEADRKRLEHHGDYNVAAYSFTPDELAGVVRKVGSQFGISDFQMEFKLDPVRQRIADSWADSMDDSAARSEWGWKPDWSLERTVYDMMDNLVKKQEHKI
ncbi:MAG: NAD-dependent epimerase/dehydratase family protein [Candidatus Aenigmarchaeota archaeon]|nr:NAD-dependent epimerase/dehydratase family protein [Candidatus Aenigmarchaeota archaeon]